MKKMTITFLMLTLLTPGAFAAELTADQILKEVDKKVHSEDESAKIKMVIVDSDGTEKERNIEILRQANKDKQAVRVKLNSPADLRGTGLLSVSEKGQTEQWLYLPSSKQTRRILGSGRGSNFLDSELSYEDLGTTNDTTLKNKVLRSENLVNEPTTVIESSEGKSDSAYGRILTWVSAKDFLIRKLEYYDKDNKLVKTLEFLDYKSFPGGIWRASKMVVKNVQNNRGTRLELQDLKINQGLAARQFSPASLGN